MHSLIKRLDALRCLGLGGGVQKSGGKDPLRRKKPMTRSEDDVGQEMQWEAKKRRGWRKRGRAGEFL